MKKLSSQQSSQIASTGFLVSLISYGGFWGLDLLRPGFVARFFSVHIFLIGILVFGIWWGEVMEVYTDRPWLQKFITLFCACLFGYVTWNMGGLFGGWRAVIAFFCFCIPLLSRRLLLYK